MAWSASTLFERNTGVLRGGRPVAAFLVASLLLMPGSAFGEAIPVELRETEAGWQLLRGGEPYTVRGAGGNHSLRQLAAAGGNSIRTWDADGIDALLDEAHALGLSVTVGIWLGHERHGFDYGDDTQVARQKERARQAVLRYKDHPAVLFWGIGNEMEGFESGGNPAVWKAVNDVAAMVKSLDPHHPTMTVTADIGGDRIANVHERSPAIDIHGINSYGGARSLYDRLRAAGAVKPYLVTEFGPPGPWEVAKTAWGAVIEPTSTEKANAYRDSYEQAVLKADGFALGSYAFTWGFKMEATATWFGMFLPDGSRLAAVDVMTELWSGRGPSNRVPTVEPLRLDGEAQLNPGDEVRVYAGVSDPEDDALSVRWVLRPESMDYVTGGDFRPDQPDIDGAVLRGDTGGATLRVPEESGPYRLFLYVHDDSGGAATASIPLLVKGEVRTRFPIVVYEDGFEGMPWVPSGWMGNHEALTLDGEYTDTPFAGSRSIRMRYEGPFGWAAVAWQDPPNNWGDVDGGYDLGGATELELWARGEYGGERVGFGVGLLEDDRRYPDSARTAVEGIVLTREWKRYRVPLRKLDLSSIKTGFVVTISGRQTAVTVYSRPYTLRSPIAISPAPAPWIRESASKRGTRPCRGVRRYRENARSTRARRAPPSRPAAA